jgi:hypothetical protein
VPGGVQSAGLASGPTVGNGERLDVSRQILDGPQRGPGVEVVGLQQAEHLQAIGWVVKLPDLAHELGDHRRLVVYRQQDRVGRQLGVLRGHDCPRGVLVVDRTDREPGLREHLARPQRRGQSDRHERLEDGEDAQQREPERKPALLAPREKQLR